MPHWCCAAQLVDKLVAVTTKVINVLVLVAVLLSAVVVVMLQLCVAALPPRGWAMGTWQQQWRSWAASQGLPLRVSHSVHLGLKTLAVSRCIDLPSRVGVA